MQMPTSLMSTWRDGLLVVCGNAIRHELAGRPVCGLLADGAGGALAIVDGRELAQRSADGAWRTVATSEVDLACCVRAGGRIYVGRSDDPSVACLDEQGRFQRLDGFDAVAGRERWYAGAAVVDGQLLGPPLGIRSMAATCDGAVLLANVHVGGIPRSTDGGATWRPTIDVEADVHQVCAHPSRANVVAAAAAVGLCLSHDAGASWTIEREGLHAPYCSAVTFVDDDVLVAASSDHFAAEGAIYRKPIDGRGPLEAINVGLPRWRSGICDTGCIATGGSAVVLADRAGHLFRSSDAGRTWSVLETGHSGPSAVAML
jgi:photosystem II stability/assembly factor-like uncharacterized protein